MTKDPNFVEYSLPSNAYASFDAMSMKQQIINKLTTSGVFTDQVFEGSNLNAIIDIVAYMYHILLFQLNQNASEGVFTQTTIYENMNKLVTLLNYKPTGQHTSLLDFTMTANAGIPAGVYLIRRFCYITVDGYNYTAINDINFEKTIQGVEQVITNNIPLYQGTLTEYPTYVATGESFETVFIAYNNLVDVNTQKFVSDNTFSVFVREGNDGKWYAYTETPSLYLNTTTDRVFERRLNENGRYEIKFGDGVTGKKLATGDAVGIYFILSDGAPGVVSANALLDKKLLLFNSSRFNAISRDIYGDVTFITQNDLSNLAFDNKHNSTPVSDSETVDEIRVNAPKLFSAQNRAVTLTDYKSILDKNFNYILASTQAVNNNQYINTYMKYFYDIGVGQPNEDTDVLLNQVTFMTSTNFNNVYLFMVPKFGTIRNETTPATLSVSQKQLVVTELNKVKSATHEVVPMDAIYKAFSFGLNLPGERLSPNIKDETFLVIKRSELSKQSRLKIKNDAISVITSYFNIENSELGQVVDLTALSNSILAIEGVSQFYTRRVSGDRVLQLPVISLLYWNPNYAANDINITAQNVPLQIFEFPFFYQQSLLSNKIIVENE
jgi:DNA-dependent RNA polymerase auxiliary subunit epsilon